MASAYLLTGEDRFLEAAEKGTEYLREHMRFYDTDEDWSTGITASRSRGDREQKLLTSEFGDDLDSIPMYEQIYALAGPIQTYRITGDPRILQRHREDDQPVRPLLSRTDDQGGYFSHLDPLTLDPRAESAGPQPRPQELELGRRPRPRLPDQPLPGHRRARSTPTSSSTPPTRSPSTSPTTRTARSCRSASSRTGARTRRWGWQQNRARRRPQPQDRLEPDAHPPACAPRTSTAPWPRKIAELMPEAGSDQQRGGWYDVVERTLGAGRRELPLRLARPQGVVAAGAGDPRLPHPERLARRRRISAPRPRGAAFYNAFFLDHDDGGVYFNVLANGMPYLLGNERFKGSHSMSALPLAPSCATSRRSTRTCSSPSSRWTSTSSR